ncbi:MAG: methionyl-tRNA formyltransferase [Bacteroidetes bacterium]|nr:MAG: methionyl-tRNA formyltransferase [Bacteroidota bacterium]
MNKPVTLFIMTEKGLISLRTIVDNGLKHAIDFIIVGRDKNVLKDYAKEIIELAETEQITWVERNDQYSVVSKYAVAISWRWLITVKKSATKLIVLHDSLLPKYRGFAPLVNQLINKEPFVGVTALFASSEFDRGDIIFQEKRKINYPIKIEAVITIVSKIYCRLLIKIFKIIISNSDLPSLVQDEKKASYSLWRDEKDYRIDWSKDADYLERFINSVGFPYAGASCMMDNMLIRITDVEQVDDVKIMNRDYGKILFINNGYPVIVCGKGLLMLKLAFFDQSNKHVIPLNKFRIRFT